MPRRQRQRQSKTETETEVKDTLVDLSPTFSFNMFKNVFFAAVGLSFLVSKQNDGEDVQNSLWTDDNSELHVAYYVDTQVGGTDMTKVTL